MVTELTVCYFDIHARLNFVLEVQPISSRAHLTNVYFKQKLSQKLIFDSAEDC